MSIELKPNTNQALEIGKFACEFMQSASPSAHTSMRSRSGRAT